jgi:hypothetical protein
VHAECACASYCPDVLSPHLQSRNSLLETFLTETSLTDPSINEPSLTDPIITECFYVNPMPEIPHFRVYNPVPGYAQGREAGERGRVRFILNLFLVQKRALHSGYVLFYSTIAEM